jgi:hypothetical protein
MTLKHFAISLGILAVLSGLAVANDYYTHGSFPSAGSPATSASMRAELDLITAGFDKLPSFTGNANKPVVINGGANGLTVTSGTLTLPGNFAISGAFATTLTVTNTTSLTLPTTGTVATLTGVEIFSGKTLNSPVINTPTGLTKADVGLSNVDNTSDATKDAAATILTNKVLITPIITAPGISSPAFSGTASGSLTNLILTTSTVAADPTTALGIADKQYVDQKHFLSVMENGRLVVTMAANAVTIALKGNDGNDPSATNPVRITFRSSSLTSSAYVTRTISAALSTVISSGSTGGTVNAIPARIYVDAIDNAGTVELGWFNTVSGTSLYARPESDLVTTIAEGGAGAADSALVIYSTTARSSVAHRVIGYFEATEATAGTWATAASTIQLIGPGVRRTGDVVQSRVVFDGEVATGTTPMPSVGDDTIPQNTEGTQFLSLSLTPTNAINVLQVDALLNLASTTNDQGTVALFQDSIANALAATQNTFDNVNRVYPSVLHHAFPAGTINVTTFKVRFGIHNAGTITFNGSSGARQLGGVMKSFLRITEVFA